MLNEFQASGKSGKPAFFKHLRLGASCGELEASE
jgi:hypothetical protein